VSIKPVGANYPQEGKPVVAANNGKVLTSDVTAPTSVAEVRAVIVSTSGTPTGGVSGDIWITYTP
jgi:hypothetical protein